MSSLEEGRVVEVRRESMAGSVVRLTVRRRPDASVAEEESEVERVGILKWGCEMVKVMKEMVGGIGTEWRLCWSML